MINENKLRDALVWLAMGLKGDNMMIMSLMCEIVALRETVRALDPTFGEVLERKRLEASQNNSLHQKEILERIELAIKAFSAGDVC